MMHHVGLHEIRRLVLHVETFVDLARKPGRCSYNMIRTGRGCAQIPEIDSRAEYVIPVHYGLRSGQMAELSVGL